MGLAGYARIYTNLEGKAYKIEELTGLTSYDKDYIKEFINNIMNDDVFEAKNCDLLVTLYIKPVECRSLEHKKYEDELTFPNIIILQTNIKEKFKTQILALDKFIERWDNESIAIETESFSSEDNLVCKQSDFFDGYIFETTEEAKEALYSLHDEYKAGYNEDIQLVS